jgi:hypothetical protein
LFNLIFRSLEYTDDIARQFYGNVQTVVNNWLLFDGMSIGIGDTIADEQTGVAIKEHLEKATKGVAEIVTNAQNGKLTVLPGMTIRATFESLVNAVLNKARKDTGESSELSLSEFNNFKSMSVAGSKGSTLNISQVSLDQMSSPDAQPLVRLSPVWVSKTSRASASLSGFAIVLCRISCRMTMVLKAKDSCSTRICAGLTQTRCFSTPWEGARD